MSEKRIQIKDVVKNQIPQYVKEDFPLVGEFLSQYYLAQEFQGAPIDLLQNIDRYVRVDSTTELKTSTILGSNISEFDENINISLLDSETGTKGFPEKYGLISIDNELILYETKTESAFINCYRGFSGIVAYKNTNVGIAATYKLNPNDELIFKQSSAETHTEGTEIFNLSGLFLQEFLIKTKYQIAPGFENRTFVDKVNESLLLKQIKDFYRSKGTDRSFEILFKALYGEDVKIIRPKDLLFRPSDAQYKVTNDLVVELISGPIEKIPNLTLFQNNYLNLSKAYGTVSEVETITSDEGKIFYKLKIDGGYNRDPAFDGAIYGKFSVHSKTRSIEKTIAGSTSIVVDSTVGFSTTGELYVQFFDGTTGVVSYTSKTLNQFLGCSNVISDILDNSVVGINTYAYATTSDNTEIRVRINSILNNVNIDTPNYFYSKGDTATIPTFGFEGKNALDNDWIFNTATTYDVLSYNIVDNSDKTYSLTFNNRHSFQIGDSFEILQYGIILSEGRVVDVLSEKTIIISGQGELSGNIFKVKRKILKVNSSNFSDVNVLSANIQNVYRDKEKLLVASSSLPSYVNQSLNVTNRSITFSGTYQGETISLTSLEDHGFYTGDSIYYTPETREVTSIDADGNFTSSTVVSSSLFEEGIYFIKRIDANNVKFAKSKSDILNQKFVNVENETTVSNNKIEPYIFYQKTLQSQKLLREISDPVPTKNPVETLPGLTGILANGVEILNYKSKDKIFYGPIENIDVLSTGDNYDVINPPQIIITDSIGSGATGNCSVSGSLLEIRVLDPGFDYFDTPVVKITGGNGEGARARANMKLVSHQVAFNSEEKSALVSVGATLSTIGFSTSHKFRNAEAVIYKTFGQKSVSGLTTNSTYYVSVISPSTVKLHQTFGDAISGINTVTLSDYGIGNHSLESVNKKSILSSVTVENSGTGYQNKRRQVSLAGINTSTDSIYITNHGFSSGEIVKYSTDGTVIGGLSNNTNYYITTIDDNSFRLSEVASSGSSEDFFYTTKQYVNITSGNSDQHIFNYPEISVSLIGNVGVSSIYKAQIEPIFRGSIESVQLVSGGSSYGIEDIFGVEREPNISILGGRNAEFQPIISNGQIVQVLVNNVGRDYTSSPDLIVTGEGSGAVLVPIVQNNQIVEVRVIESGGGYSQESTTITASHPGTGAQFKANIKSWTVNLFQKYINKISEDDGFLSLGTNGDFGLQYTHIYAPRKLREILFSREQGGGILYSNPDLRISNSVEIASTDHSPIIGWAYDGNPIYGPYGYSSKSGGVVSQMKSGYRVQLGEGRPSINFFPEGFFVEDYVHYDSEDETILDENNGRFCITPEYPNGTYAYFATISNSSVDSSGPFTRYRRPVFPYLIGNTYKSNPNQFNFDRFSNQDDIDLNETNWVRNTYPYNITENQSTYQYVTIPNNLNQTIDIVGVSPGSIDSVGILTGGNNYKINDSVIFDNFDIDGNTRGYSASAVVSKLSGKQVSSVSVASSTISNVEFYPIGNKGQYVLYANTPHNFTNFDLISISGVSTTSSYLEGNYIAGIETSKVSLVGSGSTTIGISTVGSTGIVTFISVAGNLGFSNIRENDILLLNDEKVKVLNIDPVSSRLRILREIDGTIGVSHTVTTVLYEKPRRLTINSGFKTDYSYSLNKQIYFDPRESVAIGTDSSLGAGSTVIFSNPGAGLTQVFVGNGLIYLPGHNLNTGDLLTYNTNNGSPITVYSIGVGSTTLFDDSDVYVAKYDDNFIGISTVKVGLGSTGFFSGISATTSSIRPLLFTGVGTGVYHSFKTNYSVITGTVSRNIVTVSTAQTHGLVNNDLVEIDVNPAITTSISVKYDDYNRKILLNPKSFIALDVDIANNSITISNHNFKSGDKVIHTSQSPSGGLSNEGTYYIIVVDKNNIKLSDSYYNSTKLIPDVVSITSASVGTISLVNPAIKVFKDSAVEFNLSDSSLSYEYQSSRYPAFRFEVYRDNQFREIFDTSGTNRTFNVQRSGVVGISSNAKARIIVNDTLPKTLYYNLVPVYDNNLPLEKSEIKSDNTVHSYNEIQVESSGYNGLKTVKVPTTTTFTYFLVEEPESSSYSPNGSVLNYYTNSNSAYGPIKEIKVLNKGLNYYSLPSITNVSSNTGIGAVLEAESKSIGVVRKTKILDVGFDYPSDYTLKPKVSLPKVVKIDSLSSFQSIGVSSVGRGYVTPPKLLVFDGKTGNLIPEVDLKYEFGKNDVIIRNNTFGMYNTTPTILPVDNSNGVGIRTISYNSSSKKVTVGLSTGFSTLSSFPFQINDKVLIENISVGVGSTGKGFNSQNYNYQLFTLTDVDENIGGIGSVSYSLDGYLNGSEFPGNFDPTNSVGRIIPQKFFPQFTSILTKNNYRVGEVVTSGSSSGVVEAWDPITNYLKIVTKDDFEIGEKIEGLSSKTQGFASSVTGFDYYAVLDSTSKFENGWETSAGFLNNEEQRIQDNFYYQNFSYSIKSKIPFDTWNDVVSTLNHTVGFRKFSDLQLESKVSPETNTSLAVGVSTQTTGVEVIVDMIGYADLNCFYDFDLAKENSLRIESRVVSNQISFNNRILTDYFESFGNRVLSIDDISSQFNSNPRPTNYSEINRFDLREVQAQKYITYIRDKRYTGQRQAMIVTLIHDGLNGYLNQYGRVETSYDLGSFDFAISGSDGILNYYPTRFTINDYDVVTLSYNLKDDLSGIGSTTIGSVVEINTSNSSVSAASTVNIVSLGTTYTSAKILVEISAGDGQYELDELNLVHDGTNVEFLEYGQLTTGDIISPLSSSGYGTYYPYISGSQVKVDFISNAGIGTTTYINTISIGIANTSSSGIGTLEMKHALLKATTTSIASSVSPISSVILDYSGEYSAAYCLVQVTDITNNRHQMSEIIMIDDDVYADPYITEFGNLETYAGLGTVGGSVTGIGETTQLTFTPLPNIETQVKVYANILRIQDDSRDIVDLNNGTIETAYGNYTGTESDLKRAFNLTHKGDPIFERYFDGSDPSIIDTSENTIEIPGHFFVTGEKITYTNAGSGTTTSVGIATTTISGFGSTDKLPSTLYIVKINENKVRVSASATDALLSIPNTLDITSVGVGSTHRFTAHNQNAKVLVSLDNIIQSPIVATSVVSSLSTNTYTTDDILYFTGITSFFGGDLIRVENEIMKIEAVGVGLTNAIRVRRPWLGTVVAGYSTGTTVTKVQGTYNIVDNTLNFVEAPYGNVPIGSTTNPPDERDWTGISTSSHFHGRSFMRSGIVNTGNETYYKNYIFNDISSDFDGVERTFTLRSDGSNVTGISNENAIVLINDVFQGPGTDENYTLSESTGITSISFTGTATSVAYDINSSNLPIGGIIISVGSTEGFGYQPLVAAGGTAIVSVAGTISSVSIGNSGSGYRVGVQTVRVGVQTSDSNGFYLEFIGTAAVSGGNIVSIAITNPGVGYTSTNPPEVIIDSPLSYSDIPLIYSSTVTAGLGTAATIDIVVGQGSSVIDFEIKNTGYGYRENEVLTVPVGGLTGIPTTSSYDEFQVTIQNVFSDKFTGWSVGELQVFDNISSLFDGETTTFPLTINGDLVSIKAAKGSNINVQDLLLVFVNDILQVPGEGYVFNGGSVITFTEAPKGISLGIPGTNDTCKILFYRGSGSVDVLERNILETVKVGDELVFGYDSSIGQSPTLQEEDRTVTSILATDLVNTNPYFGPGNTSDESLSRTITWCRQTEDKIIDEQEIAKDRMLYEPLITPSSYIIRSVGIGSTEIYVDNVRPFFNAQNESATSLSFQNKVTLISQDEKVGASATAVVSVAGTISSIIINDGGSGYTSSPIVTIGSTAQSVGLGTTATATASITSGIVTSITLTNSGTGYTTSNPPVVLVSPPTSIVETNDVSSYSGDSGIIVGFGTTTVGSDYQMIFDLHIPEDSYMRSSTIVGTALTLSGISTGDFFVVYDSNIGTSATSLLSKDSSGTTIAIGTSFIDNVYQVTSVSSVTSTILGIGTTVVSRVNVTVTGMGITNSGIITTSTYFGNYSWGKINLTSRSENNEFTFYGNNGVSGITTSSLVNRSEPLKYKNYLT
jgi:hypothetical protein